MPMDEYVPEGEQPVYTILPIRPPRNGDYRFTLGSQRETFLNGEWIPSEPAQHIPRRGSDVEAWIKARRDSFQIGHHSWYALDELLDDYREKADQGLMLADDHTDPDVTP
jgi:hypothetical protein